MARNYFHQAWIRRRRHRLLNADTGLAQGIRIGVLGEGQSNWLTTDATPALSTEQPYSNLRVDAGTIVALVETTQESPASGCANFLAAQDGRIVYVSNEAVGGTAYDGLDQGSTPSNNTITNAGDMFDDCDGQIRFANVWWHGEQDTVLGASAATYEGYMVDRQADLQADLRTATGDATIELPLFMVQLGNYSQYGSTVSSPAAPVAIGQWDAAESSDLITIVAPSYMIDWQASGDSLHAANTGSRRMGEYMGKAIHWQLVQQRGKWEPLHIETATAIGNVITLTYAGGDGSDLVIDTTNMRARNTAGFEYVDANSRAWITNVQASGRTITLTLSDDATATGHVYYGWRCPWEGTLGSTGYGTGGNVRDSDPTPSIVSGTLPNWAIIQDVLLDSFTAGAGVTLAAWANTNSFRSPASGGLLRAFPFTSLNGATQATWSFWVRRDTWSASGLVLWARNQASGGRQWSFVTATGGTGAGTFFIAINTSTNASFTTANSTFANATWYHITVVYDGSQGTANNRCIVYVNGTSVAAGGTYSGTMPTSLTTPGANAGAGMTFFGNNTGGTHAINSNIRDAAIWVGTAFSGAEVTELYNAGAPFDLATHSQGTPDHWWFGEVDYDDRGGAATPAHLTAFDAMTFSSANP